MQRHYFVDKIPSSQNYDFSSSHVWMWELDCEESWALKTWCFWTVVLEKSLESPLDCKEVQPVHPKGHQPWGWNWNSNTLATWCKELTHWKRPWCRERLKVGGKRDGRGRNDWMASPTQWTWVWVNSKSWWCHLTISSPHASKEAWCVAVHGVTKSQTRLHDWTELNWCCGGG